MSKRVYGLIAIAGLGLAIWYFSRRAEAQPQLPSHPVQPPYQEEKCPEGYWRCYKDQKCYPCDIYAGKVWDPEFCVCRDYPSPSGPIIQPQPQPPSGPIIQPQPQPTPIYQPHIYTA